jgi:UDP-N-acetylmuramate dehydrogenase
MAMVMPALLERIAAETGAELSHDVSLSGFTTLRLGGTARAMLTCRTTESLVACVRRLDAEGLRALLLAGGSNLIIADGALDLVVVRIATSGITIEHVGDQAIVRVQAGENWDDVVAQTVQAGLGGLECLSGIPGSAGATPVQNVGAFGVEVESLLRRVQLLDRCSGEVGWAKPSELGLGYRTSTLKRSDRALVLAAEFVLSTDGQSAPLRYRELNAQLGAKTGDRREAASVRRAVLALRAAKGMVLNDHDHDTWSAGSFFTNPVVDERTLQRVRQAVTELLGGDAGMPAFPDANGTKLSAAWLIERAGFGKGYPGPEAPVRLSTRHTLALTNRGAGTTRDLLALAREIRNGVEAVFGVRLVPEPVLIGCEI